MSDLRYIPQRRFVHLTAEVREIRAKQKERWNVASERIDREFQAPITGVGAVAAATIGAAVFMTARGQPLASPAQTSPAASGPAPTPARLVISDEVKASVAATPSGKAALLVSGRQAEKKIDTLTRARQAARYQNNPGTPVEDQLRPGERIDNYARTGVENDPRPIDGRGPNSFDLLTGQAREAPAIPSPMRNFDPIK